MGLRVGMVAVVILACELARVVNVRRARAISSFRTLSPPPSLSRALSLVWVVRSRSPPLCRCVSVCLRVCVFACTCVRVCVFGDDTRRYANALR